MIVLSLFDGMSCGQIALSNLCLPIKRYYASEIDKFAIKQTQHNFPNTIQLGDVENWKSWNIDFSKIDLLIAGSPCQGFSFAGKKLALDDPRSKLFFVFVDILNHIKALNPDVKFLLENVDMKRSHMEVITRYVGVFPVNINSNLVSAQNRNRWYWTNIATKSVGLFGEIHSDIPQPKDRGILLRDILEEVVDERYFVSNAVIDRIDRKSYSKPLVNTDKTGTINTKNNSGQMSIDSGTTFIKINKNGFLKQDQDKASCFTAGAHSGGNHSDMDLILQLGRGFNKGGLYQYKTPTVSSNSWEQNNLLITEATKQGFAEIKPGECFDAENPTSKTRRGRKMEYKSNCLMAGQNNFMQFTTDYRIRRLTPTECAKLQTIPDWYKWIVSDTQIYRMCGNGWTVEVIMHILSQYENN